MTHEASHQALDFGTAAIRDGESLYTAFPKIDADLLYQFQLADSQARYCDTVLDLQNLTKMQDGEAVILLGYHSVGDGGGTILYYNASSTDTCNGCLVFDGPGGDNSDLISSETWGGTGTGRFHAANPTTRTVRQCGVYGDGTNAGVNTIRFNAALGVTAIEKLEVPQGTYNVDGILYPHGNTCIHGCGTDATINLTTTQTGVFWCGAGADDMTFDNLHITGTDATYGIFIWNVAGAVYRQIVDHCFIECKGGVGVLECINLVVRNCLIVSKSTGIADIIVTGDSLNWLLEDNRCYGDADANIEIDVVGLSSSDLHYGGTIKGNVCDTVDANLQSKTPTNKLECIKVQSSSSGGLKEVISVVGNQCHNALNHGIYFVNGAANTKDTFVIQDNIVSNCGHGGALYTGGIKIWHNGHIRVVGNTVRNHLSANTSAGIYIDGRPTYNDIFVSDNKIFADSTKAHFGIYFEGEANSLTIKDNEISTYEEGIKIATDGTSGNEIIIEGNKVTVEADKNGIYIDNAGTAEHVVVQNNTVITGTVGTDYSTQGGIVFVEPAISILDNYIKGFETGIRSTTNLAAGRTMATSSPDTVDIRGNRLEDCGDVFTLRGADSTSLVPVIDNVIAGTWTNIFGAGGGGTNAGVVADEIQGKLQVVSDATPTTGTWAVGDIVWDSNVTINNVAGWICTTAGSPGTWNPIGANIGNTDLTFTGDRTISMNNENLTFNNAQRVEFNDDSTTAQMLVKLLLRVYGPTAAQAGSLRLFENSDVDYVGWRSPSSVTSSYETLLPSVQPPNSGLMLAVSSGAATSNPVLSWTRAEAGLDDLGNISGSTAVDFTASTSNNKEATLTGAVTFTTLTGTTNRWHTLILKSDTGASRAITWPSNVKGSPPASVTSQDGVPIRFFYDGTNYLY